MEKINTDYIIDQYRSGIRSYESTTKNIGLWDSEKYVFEKYLDQRDNILDLGCGTGRTTFPLEKMGYNQITGVDLTPDMIEVATQLNCFFDTQINFEVGDATNLKFSNDFFDAVIFSFNGLMSIPNAINRDKAFNEVNRVLKESGVFIFTTHDRERGKKGSRFWEEEKEKWQSGKQNPLLFEYGDLITKSRNEPREIFIHIPNQEEVEESLKQNDFKLIETFYRSDKFEENEEVKLKSSECRFWIAEKVSSAENLAADN